MITYRRAWINRYFLNSYVNELRGIAADVPDNGIEEVISQMISIPEGTKNAKEYFKSKVEGILPDDLDINKMEDLEYCTFLADKQVNDCFKTEHALIVKFIMFAV